MDLILNPKFNAIVSSIQELAKELDIETEEIASEIMDLCVDYETMLAADIFMEKANK